MEIEKIPFSVPRRKWGYYQVFYFQVNVSYSLDDYEWGRPDNVLEDSARTYRGYSVGAGTGFGERDIDFAFFTHIEMLAFIQDAIALFPKLQVHRTTFEGLCSSTEI